MNESPKKPEEVIVHHSCARPVKPAGGTEYTNPKTGYTELWDGKEWIPQRKKDAWKE